MKQNYEIPNSMGFNSFNELREANHLYDVRKLARLFNFSSSEFFSWLLEKGYIFRDNNNKTYLTSEAVDKSYGFNFTCRRESVDSKSRRARLIYCYRFTPYGAVTLLREFEQDNHVVRWSSDSCL